MHYKRIIFITTENNAANGGAVALTKNVIKGGFLVMMGDDLYVKEDVARVMKHDLGLLGLEISNPRQFGVISLNENGNLQEIIEKPDIPGPALANIGLYKLNVAFFSYPLVAIGKGEYGLPQGLALMAKDFPVHVEKATAWFPIGNPDDLKNAHDVIVKFLA